MSVSSRSSPATEQPARKKLHNRSSFDTKTQSVRSRPSNLDQFEGVLVHSYVQPGNIAAWNRRLGASGLSEQLQAAIGEALQQDI